MTRRRTGSFEHELELPYPPARVFAAFAELPRGKRWFQLPGGSSTATHELDFRVGGREVLRNTSASGGALEFSGEAERGCEEAGDQPGVVPESTGTGP